MKRRAYIVSCVVGVLTLSLFGCSGESSTSGSEFVVHESIKDSSFDEDAATEQEGGKIDVSNADLGYFAASSVSNKALKLQVVKGQMSYNYNLPSDGTPIVVPANMGDGSYRVRIMRNTTDNNYVEVAAEEVEVELSSEFAPFLVPNLFCNYQEDSACVAKARELVGEAENEGDALERVCTYVVENIKYDNKKAAELMKTTGYTPDPDETLASGSGVCFDYASLGAAMLRSQGIPTKIVTGYVSPNEVYHAWIMVYIDGTWKSAQFSVDESTWSRVDLTFAASDGSYSNIGNGENYTDRYVY